VLEVELFEVDWADVLDPVLVELLAPELEPALDVDPVPVGGPEVEVAREDPVVEDDAAPDPLELPVDEPLGPECEFVPEPVPLPELSAPQP
jgi:hypothetical protein